MTMQTNSLPFQVNGANTTPQRANASPDRLADSSASFGANLSREMAARQQAPQPTAPTPAAQQAKPAQQQSKPAEAAKPANREPVREQAKAAAKPAQHETDAKPAQATRSSEGAEETGDAAEAADAAAAAATPVTDMLAFMASLTRASATNNVAAEAAAGAEVGEQSLTALENAMKNMTGAGADAAAGDGQELASGVKQAPLDAAALGKDAALLDQKAGEQDTTQFAAHLRNSQQHAADAAAEEAPIPLTQLQAQAAKLEAAAPAAVPGDRIPARVGTQAWDNQVSQRIVYMVGKEQAATLTLNPPDLGPVQIVLNVSNDQASVQFSAEQLEVRQALENSLPRLREMMSESGITLSQSTVDANVQDQRQQQQDSQRRTQGNGGNGDLAGTGQGEAAVNEVAPRTRTVAIGDRGMVDLFA